MCVISISVSPVSNVSNLVEPRFFIISTEFRLQYIYKSLALGFFLYNAALFIRLSRDMMIEICLPSKAHTHTYTQIHANVVSVRLGSSCFRTGNALCIAQVCAVR